MRTSVVVDWDDLAVPLSPGRLTLLEGHGDLRLDVAMDVAGRRAAAGHVVRIVDPGVASFGRFERVPAEAIGRVLGTRGFSLAGVPGALARPLPATLEARGESCGLLVLMGVAEACAIEESSRREAFTLARRALAALKREAERLDVPALLVNGDATDAHAMGLRGMLETHADEVVWCWREEALGHFALPLRGARFRLPLPA